MMYPVNINSGAGIFVTTVVVGGVAFIAPFKLTKRPFLRDIIFYTTAVYLTFYVLWTGSVTIYMAAGMRTLLYHSVKYRTGHLHTH